MSEPVNFKHPGMPAAIPPTMAEVEEFCEEHAGNAIHDIWCMWLASRSAFSGRKYWLTDAEEERRDEKRRRVWFAAYSKRAALAEARRERDRALRYAPQITVARESTIPALWQQRTPAITAAAPIVQRRNQRRY